MSTPYNGFVEDQRDDFSSHRDTSTSTHTVPTYGMTGGDVANPAGRRSFGAISKDMIRTFQTTIQNNSRSNHMMPQNAPVSHIMKPQLQKIASEGSRIVNSVQNSAVIDGVSGKLSSVNDKIGSMLRRSSTGTNFSMTRNHSDRGIYSAESMRTWGSTVSSGISNFATQKVVPVFKRQNTYPSYGNENNPSQANMKGAKEVSFDYQLMKDYE